MTAVLEEGEPFDAEAELAEALNRVKVGAGGSTVALNIIKFTKVSHAYPPHRSR